MCTGLNFITKDNVLFGRNFDYEKSYKEQIVVTPRDYVFRFTNGDCNSKHSAIMGIGAGSVPEYPLYYDAMNEEGLCVAGLNFEGNAIYNNFDEDMTNIAPWEFIPFLLCYASDVSEVEGLLANANIVDIPYSDDLPNSPLHWIISDKEGNCIVVEPVYEGLKVYRNDVSVLTNNPQFPLQISELNKYRGLSTKNPDNSFGVELDEYSRGMGAIGLCGDYSSTSRFVRASFVRANAYKDWFWYDNIYQFFHILGSVEQIKGLTELDNGEFEYTIYSDCYLEDKLYFKSYNSCAILSRCFDDFDLESSELIWSFTV